MMNDTEVWLRCDTCNSYFLGGWAFHPGTRCADILACAGLSQFSVCQESALEGAGSQGQVRW
jgi:hypothetical protein